MISTFAFRYQITLPTYRIKNIIFNYQISKKKSETKILLFAFLYVSNENEQIGCFETEDERIVSDKTVLQLK